MTRAIPKKPNMLVPIVICILFALPFLALGGFLLDLLIAVYTDDGPCCGSGTIIFPADIPAFTSEVIPMIAVLLGMGLFLLLAALLLWRQPRIGRILAAILFAIEVLINIYIVLHGIKNLFVPQFKLIYPLGILLGLVGFIYVLRPMVISVPDAPVDTGI